MEAQAAEDSLSLSHGDWLSFRPFISIPRWPPADLDISHNRFSIILVAHVLRASYSCFFLFCLLLMVSTHSVSGKSTVGSDSSSSCARFQMLDHGDLVFYFSLLEIVRIFFLLDMLPTCKQVLIEATRSDWNSTKMLISLYRGKSYEARSDEFFGKTTLIDPSNMSSEIPGIRRQKHWLILEMTSTSRCCVRVEAAAIRKPITLKPGEEWRGILELYAVPSGY